VKNRVRRISSDANLRKLLLTKGFEPDQIDSFEKNSNVNIWTFKYDGENKAKIKRELILLGFGVIECEGEFFISASQSLFEKQKCLLSQLLPSSEICENISIKEMILKENRKISLNKTNIMGIINVTQDSFYEGSRYFNQEEIQNAAYKMIKDGADIIVIGGQSTRPYSNPISEDEELRRVSLAVKAIRNVSKNIPISVDTYYSRVAEEALNSGADIINDISGGTFDRNMFKIASYYQAPIVIMHIKGTPQNMQDNPYYKDVIGEIYEYFERRIDSALSEGIKMENIILDPGIGFGKRLEDNLEIIKRCDEFKSLNCPVLIGASRKSTIGAVLGNLPPDERLEGTLAITSIAAQKGIEFVRVHDVKENKRVVDMVLSVFGL